MEVIKFIVAYVFMLGLTFVGLLLVVLAAAVFGFVATHVEIQLLERKASALRVMSQGAHVLRAYDDVRLLAKAVQGRHPALTPQEVVDLLLDLVSDDIPESDEMFREACVTAKTAGVSPDYVAGKLGSHRLVTLVRVHRRWIKSLGDWGEDLIRLAAPPAEVHVAH